MGLGFKTRRPLQLFAQDWFSQYFAYFWLQQRR